MIRRLFGPIVLFVLLACGLSAKAQAQGAAGDELFLPADVPAGATVPASLMQHPYRPVRINKALLDSAHPGQIVTLHLFNDTPLSLLLERREVHIPGTYSWVGRLTGELESLFIISVVNDAASLCLSLGGSSEIKLRYLSGGVHLLLAAEPPAEFRCTTPPTTVRLPDPEPGFGFNIQSVAVIDTSLCVSDQAVAELGGFNAAVSQGINCVVYTNNACSASNSQVQINLYAVYQIPFDESGSSGQILNRFRNNAFANNLLDQGALDVVGLIISNFPLRDAGGVANTAGQYSVSEVALSFTEHTYAHEVGHNLGNGHEPGDQFPEAPEQDRGVYHYSAGYHFEFLSQYFQTIMAYGQGYNGWWIRNYMPRYSNPSVRYESSPGIGGITGVANDRDNARSMRDYGSTVAAYGSVGSNVYVDGGAIFGANGSQLYPYVRVVDAMNAVPNGGNVWVRGPRNYNERPVTGKQLFLRNWLGVVNIGR